MKQVILKLNLDIDLYITSVYEDEEVVASSNKSKKSRTSSVTPQVTILEFLTNVNNQVIEILESHGFSLWNNVPRNISQRNGGFAFYDTYAYYSDNVVIKLILNVRMADHPSQPDLETKNKSRIEVLESSVELIKSGQADLEILDIYCKKHDWGVQIFVGGNKEYSAPVTSFESMKLILDGKLRKMISKYEVQNEPTN